MHISHTMKAVCSSRGWLFIDNARIKVEHLKNNGIHLNADLLSELSKHRVFKLAALNVTSIPGHIEELRIYMNDEMVYEMNHIHTYIHTTLFVLAGYKKRQHMLMWTCLKLI